MDHIARILSFPGNQSEKALPFSEDEDEEMVEKGEERNMWGAEERTPLVLPTRQANCPLCKGAGILRQEVPYGHPDFAKTIECSCHKHQRLSTQRNLLFSLSHINELAAFQEESFESFRFWSSGTRPAYDAAKTWAESPSGWLVLAGPNGCGKTHLAVSIAKCALAQGKLTLFAVVPDLLDHLRATFSAFAVSAYDEEFKKMKDAQVLILDDLGAESGTPWAMEKLFQLLNYRYNGRLPTVFTTNLIGLVGIPPRVRSRLCDRRLTKIITIAAADYRELDLEELNRSE